LTNADLQVWAEDTRLLAWLHVHERSRETLLELADGGFPEGLVMGAGVEAVAMREGLVALAATPDATFADNDLAADFTAIYLTHACRVSPCESVWRDEDKLAWQGPTFAVRDWYSRYGLSVGDWRVLPDDHLAYQLEFVAHLLEKNEVEAAARFMDAHLLTFLPDFCTLIAERAATSFYSSLARLTLATVTALRQQLPDVAPEPEKTVPAKDFVAPVNFVARETWLSMS
jgi:putative dimethyl sulfoxide reductase chaperone